MRIKEACKSSSVQLQSPCRNDAARRPSDGKLLLYTARATIGLACPPPSGTTPNRMAVVVNENKQQEVTNLKRKNQSRLSTLHGKILQARRHAKRRSLSTSMKWRRKKSLANDTSTPHQTRSPRTGGAGRKQSEAGPARSDRRLQPSSRRTFSDIKNNMIRYSRPVIHMSPAGVPRS